MNSNVSYGSLSPSVIGGLGVILAALVKQADTSESPVRVLPLSRVIEFFDGGTWGLDAGVSDTAARVLRVSDFSSDFRLNYSTAPPRFLDTRQLIKYRLQSGDLLVVKSSGSATRVISGRVAVFEQPNGHTYAASNFLLRLRPTKCMDPHYLAFVLGSPQVREAVAESVKTMTYPNLAVREYLQTPIPVLPIEHQRSVAWFIRALLDGMPLPELPPYLEEQRRIVARIESLVQQTGTVRDLHHDTNQKLNVLLRSILTHDGNVTLTPMRELVKLRSPDINVVPTATYQFAGVMSFGRGVFKGPTKVGAEFSYKKLTRIRAGDFVYPKLMAWEGALGVVPTECDGCVVSPEFPVFAVNRDKVLPEVLHTHFTSPPVWPKVSGVSTGTNVRRRRLHPKTFLQYQFPLPSQATQLRLATVRAAHDQIAQMRAETAAELNALLPSILDRAFRGGL